MAFGKKKDNSTYGKIKAQSASETARYRNVHDEQQVERSYIEPKATMKGRLIFVSIITIIVMVLVWLLIGMVEKTGVLDGLNKPWYDIFYKNDGKKSNYQYLTIRDVQYKLDEFGLQVYDEDEEPVTYITTKKYIVNKDTGILTNITDRNTPVYTGCYPAYYDENGKLVYSDGYEDVYDQDGNLVTSAIGGMFGLGVADGQTPQIYLRLLPALGTEHETYLGWLEDYGFVYTPAAVVAYFDPDGKMMSGDEELLRGDITDPIFLSRYGFEPGTNKYLWVRLNRGKLVDTTGWRNHEKFTDMRPTPLKLVLALLAGGIVFGLLYMVMKKNLIAQNLMSDTSDINQHHDDSRLQMPGEIQEAYDIFPDVGAHSSVMVSSMISHQAITNKGLKKIKIAKRAKKDIIDEDTGEVEVYKGDILRDESGEPLTVEVPFIDGEFTEGLFDSSKTLKENRVYFDTPGIPYNPDNANLDKLRDYDTVAELINGDWTFPLYEPQRPGGIYIVDTAPVNTMVLAITRAGKGQTIIEPTIDMWTRESRPNNMVINDPKGELLVKNYVRGTVRGFTIVQFNLINPMKTDIYNPLSLAADAARDGNSTKCAMYVENIAEVFFPLDGGEDPLWPNAANNAFKRAAYGLIDYYLEEEKEMRRIAAVKNVNKKVLEQKIDEMWGRVTLYNCYQLFVQMSSKKLQDPTHEVTDKIKAAEAEGKPFSVEEQDVMAQEALDKMPVWDGAKEADMLGLFFNATARMPRNSMRTLVTNADNALRAMGGAEKMIASCDLLHIEKMCPAA